MEQATIGGGCYWCLEAFFRLVKGISSVESGYSGGHVDSPTAERVYQGNTGHAEVVHLVFDPTIISYREILEIFFVMHDPTTLNRQGADVGELYRSIIFYHSKEQAQIAQDMKLNFAANLWQKPAVTFIEPFEHFWPADDYMQDYYAKNPSAGYCQIVINPKIQKLRQQFAQKLIK